MVMALSIMAILLSIAISFAVFIISDINKSKSIDDSIVSYYAAETAAERTIFLFRKGGKEKTGNFLYNPDNPPSETNDPTALSASDKNGSLADNNAVWTIQDSIDYEPTVFRQRLYNGQGLKLYFLNRAATQNPASIVIDWQGISDFTKVQATFTQLNPQSKNNVLVYYTDYSDLVTALSNKCIDFRDVAIDSNIYGSWKSDYVVEIKALGSSDTDYVDTLTVKAYDSICGAPTTQNLQAITNITIRAVGNYHKSKQEIVVQLPPRDPLSGLLSFVLFSERDITKDY